MQAVIMAGGKGTRLRSVTGDALPKPMVPVAGKPLLQWQIETLREENVDDIILVVGYLGHVISSYFGDGKELGVHITYFQETEQLGTAGALPLLAELLEDDFFLIFGDVLFQVDLARMMVFHKSKQAAVTLFVHPNNHPYDSDVVQTESDDSVVKFYSKNEPRDFWYKNRVNAGMYVLNKNVCSRIPADSKKHDLEKDVLIPLVSEGRTVFAYNSPEYIKDIGTPERVQEAENELESGIVASRCLRNRQKCIFLDRDGTINQYCGLVSREEELKLEPNAAKAIRAINEAGYLAIVVTNQPVVARGLCSVADVEHINDKMETLLGQEGAYLNEVCFCPHHPDKGYPEENPLYKIPCQCRKPKTGLMNRWIDKYNIDVRQSWMIGDTTIDIQTGINAGAHTALVQTGLAGNDQKYDVVPELTGQDLLDVVNKIIKADEICSTRR